jgi:hypothetical protein
MKLISYKDAEVVSACLRRVSNESVRSFDAAIDNCIYSCEFLCELVLFLLARMFVFVLLPVVEALPAAAAFWALVLACFKRWLCWRPGVGFLTKYWVFRLFSECWLYWLLFSRIATVSSNDPVCLECCVSTW